MEFQEEGEKEWDEWKTVSIPESHVTGLEEGKTYRFRVRAENAIGLSRPDTTVPILCQEKLGELNKNTFSHFGTLDWDQSDTLDLWSEMSYMFREL